MCEREDFVNLGAVPAAKVYHACHSASVQQSAASPSALLLQLIKVAAAVLDACLKPGYETRNRSLVQLVARSHRK